MVVVKVFPKEAHPNELRGLRGKGPRLPVPLPDRPQLRLRAADEGGEAGVAVLEQGPRPLHATPPVRQSKGLERNPFVRIHLGPFISV